MTHITHLYRCISRAYSVHGITDRRAYAFWSSQHWLPQPCGRSSTASCTAASKRQRPNTHCSRISGWEGSEVTDPQRPVEAAVLIARLGHFCQTLSKRRSNDIRPMWPRWGLQTAVKMGMWPAAPWDGIYIYRSQCVCLFVCIEEYTYLFKLHLIYHIHIYSNDT